MGKNQPEIVNNRTSTKDRKIEAEAETESMYSKFRPFIQHFSVNGLGSLSLLNFKNFTDCPQQAKCFLSENVYFCPTPNRFHQNFPTIGILHLIVTEKIWGKNPSPTSLLAWRREEILESRPCKSLNSQ